jgi:hypothetical protein
VGVSISGNLALNHRGAALVEHASAMNEAAKYGMTAWWYAFPDY